MVGLFAGLFFIAFSSSLIATFFVRKFVLKHNFLDTPTDRKVHKHATPTMGGIAIWVGFSASMLAAFLFSDLKDYFLSPFIGICFAGFLIISVGIWDDLRNLSAYKKLFFQILSAIVLVKSGFEIYVISKPLGGGFTLGVLSIFITIIWIVGMINAINLIDGLDGLAAGVSAIAVFFLFLAALESQMAAVAFLSISLVGATLGFLPYNFYPAKIFMGNTGSMFLGLIIAVIALAGFQKSTAIFTLFVPLMVVALPIIDVFLSIIRRILAKKAVFKADKEHIHHKLFKIEKSQARAVLSLYFITFCFGLIALSFSQLKGGYAIIALVLVGLVTFKWLKNWGFLEFK